MIEYKGYLGIVEYDSEIEMFTGHVVDLRDQIYFEGASVDEIKASMHRAVDQYLEVCRQRGENFNEETRSVLRKSERGVEVARLDSAEALFEDLAI